MKRREDDFLWKEFLKRFLYSFIKLLHKELYDAIDTTKQYEILDPSLRITGLRKGKAVYVDFLARVPMLDGGLSAILVHVEIQGYSGKVSFDKRMFAYLSRILIKHDAAVAAVALFTGDGEPPVGKYEQKCFGTDFVCKYTLRKIDEFSEEKLRRDDSPAALMMLAVKLAMSCGNDERFKLACLEELVTLMENRNWSDEEKENMLLLCEGIIHIEDEEIEEEFWQFVRKKEEPKMFVSIFERKAKAEGVVEGMTKMVKNMFSSKIPVPKIAKIAELPESEVHKILGT